MNEARNLRNLTNAQTPLLGDENTPMHEITGRGTAFEGATPRRQISATPNPLATPMRAESTAGETPRTERSDVSSLRPGATPLRTPARDNLKINQGDRVVGDTPREERLRLEQARDRLKHGFMSLPQPKNDFELIDPEEEETVMVEVDGVRRPEDAGERDARLAKLKAEEEQRRLARRSNAVKRNLPRPTDFDAGALRADLQVVSTGADEIDRLVTLEMIDLLEHDAAVYPVAGSSRPGSVKASLPFIPDEDLADARALVHSELSQAAGFPGATPEQLARVLEAQTDPALFDAVWKPVVDSLAYDARAGAFVDASSLSPEERVAGLKAQIEAARERMTREATKAAKVEKKLNTVLGGYQARAKALSDKLSVTSESLSSGRIDLDSFERLAIREEGAVPRRLEHLQGEVDRLERRQREGQERYRELDTEKNEITARIAAAEEELMMREAEAINEAALAAADAAE
jgi:pre-mRNA-splicing factor CDC5/CEF1